ncbi:MAG: hypothetical protein AAB840_02880 [Patescibacteria group bacterium]|mgnify:CR=1 FL=1
MFNLFKLFKNKNRSSIAYIFDISSASIGGAIVKFDGGASPRIIYSKRVELEAPPTVDFKRLSLETFNALKKLALDIGKEGYSHLTFTGDKTLPKYAHCFLSSPYSLSETKILRIEKPNMVFTKTIEEGLTEKEMTLFKENISSKYPAIQNGTETLVDKKVIEIKLNGYSTSKPYGKTANIAEIALYLGITSKDILLKFEDIIMGALKIDQKVNFHTFPLASYFIINDTFNEDDFSILDITGELTDISIIKNGIVLESLSFPLAKNQLTREVARKFATSYFEADSVLKMYLDKSISKQLESKVQGIVDGYNHDFIETLRQVCPDAFSRKTYVIAPLHYGNMFVEWLKGETNQHALLVNNQLFTNKIKGISEVDAFLAIETLYMSKIL